MPAADLDVLRRYAIARTLFAPTTLARAVHQLGFIQADPIRAPARAQDLTLRHRVKNYRAGDLERSYPELDVEEDFFVNYGFVTRDLYAQMHPRSGFRRAWDAATKRRAAQLLKFVRERGTVHPREVEAHFALGQVVNYWGGQSSATTHLLDNMHYRGLLRVVRRDRGVRVYTAVPRRPPLRSAREQNARVDRLIDLVVQVYAPLPRLSLNQLVSRLRLAAPQWQPQLKAGLARARERLAHAEIAGTTWYWPAAEQPASPRHQGHTADERVRLLAPFDPLVWDRRRFELLWGWAYRFEAYTPPPKRKLGYYALPLLWRDQVVGWGNIKVRDGALVSDIGFVKRRPSERAFTRELDAELAHLRRFLGAEELNTSA
ncbi:MAG: crosslink repair DNA glycosylase YcaQ family protein [Polyangiales bacterium]